jgi:hypothetical protein
MSVDLSLTPRFSGVLSGAGDVETVSTVSILLPPKLVSLHQQLKLLAKALLSMVLLLIGNVFRYFRSA